ncbi:MAG: UvrD-helicase domain-containing protein [bacterium]
MKFIGDFHIHSHYSIATSKNLNPEFLDYWAALKGIQIVGTGDFTHPGWIKELKEKLQPAEPGLFTLKDTYKLQRPFKNPQINEHKTRFLLTSEISNIYKKNDKVRKVHNLIFAPDFQTVEKIQNRLDAIGNITSDGRPILGLDSHALLEICLEASENIFFIPAHIWTPWFSALGSKSGFNSIDECYEDLTSHIYAVETGLSSDPPMNWMCSFLDKFTLVSNSDAHSPEKLGREANLFNTELNYESITESIKSSDPDKFLGTIEFFPQEGKYHYDGHRKCNICWDPVETLKHQKKCSACGKKVTVGVMHRVAELSDRDDIKEARNRHPFYSLVPLKEIISEILRVGPQSKSVSNYYYNLLEKAGPEFDILVHLSPDQLSSQAGELITEGVRRMRSGNVIIKHGFDGEYGRIKVFNKDEIKALNEQPTFFGTNSADKKSVPEEKKIFDFNIKEYHQLLNEPAKIKTVREQKPELKKNTLLNDLNAEQRQAVVHTTGPALVIAGPGTGKTRVLSSRITYLLENHKIEPISILAITFTNKAAKEMKTRIESLIESGSAAKKLTISTFHGFGYSILKKYYSTLGRSSNFIIIDESEKKKLLSEYFDCSKNQIKRISDAISQTKQQLKTEEEIGEKNLFCQYEAFLKKEDIFDLDDLIQKVVYLLSNHNDIAEHYKKQFKWILIDEYQDINKAQYQMISLLIDSKDKNIYAVGDPNQAIYGFRGSDTRFINQFLTDFPEATVYKLKTSYRCSNKILYASDNIITTSKAEKNDDCTSTYLLGDVLKGLDQGVNIQISSHNTEKSEAEFVARSIENMMGGLRFFSMDSNITQGSETDDINSLSDFCVLCRTLRQTAALKKAFSDHSIPAQITGEEPFFRKSPAKEIIDLLKLGLHPQNSLLKKRLVNKNLIASEQINWLKKTIDDNNLKKTLLLLVDFVKEKIELKDSFTQKRILDLANKVNNNYDEFLKFTYLGSGIDTYNPTTEAVSIMTMHASKGLEFQTVFITGCEDGLIPYSYFKSQATDVEEEKRLLYVSMTRAKKYLYLTHAQKRFLFGQTKQMNPSPFLTSIKEELIERSRETYQRKPKKDDKQMGLF